MPGFRQRWLCQAAIYWLSVFPQANHATAQFPFPVTPGLRSFFTRDESGNFTSGSTSNQKFSEEGAQEVMQAVQQLVARLDEDEWQHNLRLPGAFSSLKDPELNIPLPASLHADETHEKEEEVAQEQALSVEDLASIFCDGYSNLPSLQLGAIVKATSQEEQIKGLNLQDCPRGAILSFLAQQCGPPGWNEQLYRLLQKDLIKGKALNDESLQILRLAATPRYEELFQCLLEQNSQQAVSLLVELRGDLLRLLVVLKKNKTTVSTALMESTRQLEQHVRSLLSIWFSPGLLEIRRITYNTTSAGIIEKIAVKEAVHPMKSLDDLRGRLGPKRRVFGLFHPLLPEEPLVILHCHLETMPNHIPSTMKHVMAEKEVNPKQLAPLVATFYSISNTQGGLTGGLGLGEFLIKHAVQTLKQEFATSIETFVTLSPMPTFRKYVEGIVPSDAKQVSNEELTQQLAQRGDLGKNIIQSIVEARPMLEKLILASERDPELKEQLEEVRPILTKLAAQYICVAKNRRSGKPLDPVTGFHVSNGAEVFRINFGADLSRKGMMRSFGVMVNYRYPLDNIARNKAQFESSHFSHIPMTQQVRHLLDQ